MLGPSQLSTEPATGRISLGPVAGKASVPRENVALVITACLADNSTIHRTVEFNDGTIPIPEALAAAE